MTPEEKHTQMIERNAAIARMYMEGASLAECGKRFGLKRQRIKQIVKAAGLWREQIKAPSNGRDEFLGINLSEADKTALRAEAARQGLSMSAMTSDWIKDRLAELASPTEEPISPSEDTP